AAVTAIIRTFIGIFYRYDVILADEKLAIDALLTIALARASIGIARILKTLAVAVTACIQTAGKCKVNIAENLFIAHFSV
ncbi:MAG: hypothetical protein IJM59_10760, partial [Proteobacteria bacterium]|nr:hypothetical protein [Pseudomonadota bacterium]